MNKASAAAKRKTVSARTRIAGRLSKMLRLQVDALEAQVEEGYSDARVKALLLLAKTLQAMEVAEPKPAKAADIGPFETEDIVEFRRRLERQISALGDGGEAEPLSRQPDAARSQALR